MHFTSVYFGILRYINNLTFLIVECHSRLHLVLTFSEILFAMNPKIAQKNRMIEDLSDENEGLIKENDKLYNRNKKLMKENDELYYKNKDLTYENDDLIVTNRKCSQQCGQLGNQIGQLRKQIAQLEKENDQLTDENYNLTKKNDKLSQRLQQCGSLATDAKNELLTRANNWSTEDAQMRKQIGELKMEISKLQSELESEIKKSYNNKENVDRVSKRRMNEYENEIAELTTKVHENKEAADFFKGICDAKVTEIEELQLNHRTNN